MTPELQQLVGVLIGVLALLASLIRMELLIRQAEAKRRLADAAAEQAKAERELAELAAHEANKSKDELVALGAALGASFERSSGAPPQQE
jgi:flagellar biosynthesis/type III secretory pathway M-ring protein FliF/YscJ